MRDKVNWSMNPDAKLTPEEALAWFELQKVPPPRTDVDFTINKAIEMAKQAIEKQIPKKPYYFGDGYADRMLVYDEARCPTCECDFEEGMTNWGCKFCPDCGQALDWK